MPLFGEGVLVTDVVTTDDIKKLTGITEQDLNFPNEEDQGKALDTLLKEWIERIASHIHSRLEREVLGTADEYQAIQDVLIRHVAKLVSVALQQRSSPIVQISDFAISILNTSDVTKDLGKELRPFKKGGLKIFSSHDEYIEES